MDPSVAVGRADTRSVTVIRASRLHVKLSSAGPEALRAIYFGWANHPIGAEG